MVMKHNPYLAVLHLSQKSAAEEIIFDAGGHSGKSKVWIGKGNGVCMLWRFRIPVHRHIHTLLIPSGRKIT